ncbi:hypothetical protein GCM10025859_06130 [Alicyclobacillus fastidiosus]|nr:hypothetical protein GCM10025859_06130 [Alicyclobacillus fastidiosus]
MFEICDWSFGNTNDIRQEFTPVSIVELREEVLKSSDWGDVGHESLVLRNRSHPTSGTSRL